MSKKTPDMPQTGGSYTRAKGGSLRKVEKPAEMPQVGEVTDQHVTADTTDPEGQST